MKKDRYIDIIGVFAMLRNIIGEVDYLYSRIGLKPNEYDDGVDDSIVQEIKGIRAELDKCAADDDLGSALAEIDDKFANIGYELNKIQNRLCEIELSTSVGNIFCECEPDLFPEYKTSGASCFDICSSVTMDVPPGVPVKIPTGLKFDLVQFTLLILARSSLYQKTGIMLTNAVGVIDSDYRGEVLIPVVNTFKNAVKITRGQRIAQGLIIRRQIVNILPMKIQNDTDRGAGGFGSTGD